MRLVKDLGVIFRKGSKTKVKTRSGLYECPDCLKHFEACTADVNRGKSTRCKSCSAIKTKTKHGENRTKLHSLWCSMNTRCKKIKAYENVSVCTEWKNNYIAFRDWANNNGYEEGLELDKDILCEKLNISPKIYSPETCMFVTKAENITQSNKERHK